jgi:hypothetical protein
LEGIPDYFNIIQNPMDFGTIKKKLNHNVYQNVEDFLNDMALVFNNCGLYNGTESLVGKIGVDVRREYNRLLGMYNFVERFQNSSQVHPSVLFIQDLQQKKKEQQEEQPEENNKELQGDLPMNQEENEFPIPKKIELEEEEEVPLQEDKQLGQEQFREDQQDKEKDMRVEEEEEEQQPQEQHQLEQQPQELQEEEKELSEDSLMEEQKNLIETE